MLQHFVHYSTVTKGLIKTNKEILESGGKLQTRRYSENKKSERFFDESEEAVMIHAKRMLPHETADWEMICKGKGSQHEKCHVGISGVNWGQVIPTVQEGLENENFKNKEGFIHNCAVNDNVESYWLPKLRASLIKLLER